MKAIIRTSGRILEGLALLFLVTLFLCVFTQIVMRNFFDSGSVYIEELARFSLVSLVFLMIPVLLIDRQHIVVDLLTSRLRGKTLLGTQVIVEVLIIFLAFFLLYSSSEVLLNNWSVRSPAMKMPNLVLYIPIVLGILFTALESISSLISLFSAKETSL
ncbi:MAG: TRAP transporter small permease subunit [Sphaerochaetaceae bacterium]|nr:TRAP transporter small permease subunit [Sphaerochaetaceae bacterium]